MNPIRVIKYLGSVNVFFCLFMLPSLILGLIDGAGWGEFAAAMAICLALSATPRYLIPGEVGEPSRRDGLALVALIWFSVSFFGALPFYFSGAFGSFTNCFFESVSGFTTTGATILTRVSGLPRSILLWRSMIQWLGGMGIVLLTMAVMPTLGFGGVLLFKAEVPGPSVEKLSPRIRATAKLLWGTYALITAATAACLWLAGMGGFDAVCHSFTALATGGFSTNDAGIMGFNNPAVEWVLIFAMMAAGCNFVLHYHALSGRLGAYWRSEEFRWYLCLFFALAAALFALALAAELDSPADTLRDSLFQVASIMTTTGFHSVDFDAWRLAAPAVFMLLMAAMFLGGMGGSTSGGVKTVRVMAVLKLTRNSLVNLLHPRALTRLRLNGSPLPQNLMNMMVAFLCLHVLVFLLVAAFMTLVGLEPVTALSAAAACLNNIGPGFGEVGPLGNYASIPTLGKWVLSLAMLVGRLELFTILVLLTPEFWRR